MTVIHTLTTDGGDTDISIDRNYQKETTTITICIHGDTKTITVPTTELHDLIRAAGLK